MTSVSIKIDKKNYNNETCAISDMLFSAESGEFIAIVGPSGTGKTTLLNIVAGIDQQYDGKVILNTQNSITKPNISFMFQDSRLLPWQTVKQNIELVLDENTPEIQSRIIQLLKKVGLQEVGNKFPAQLSGGMKRRVSMVRAFINQPQLLLMDEPFQSLDEPTANELRVMLLDL
ncbi:MAG: ATP-binding cassette domain-containing protein, partial [Thiotrichaceae bacterium]|nr:ATP-binding cassette domain-containing protein [Thiotrichaceae bacterium]